MGHRAAFFDLDKTLIPGSSLFLLARGLYERDYYRVRDLLLFGWGQLGDPGSGGGGGGGGGLGGEVIHGEAKARAVEELAGRWDIDLGESYAYSDSINDLPLLELVGHPQAVNPDGELKDAARARGWPVYELRSRRLALLVGGPSALAGIALFGGGGALGAWRGRPEGPRGGRG